MINFVPALLTVRLKYLSSAPVKVLHRSAGADFSLSTFSTRTGIAAAKATARNLPLSQLLLL